MKIRRQGILLCLCGPTGAGKTTISNYIISNYPPCSFSVSVTSRDPRPEDIEGKSYYFVSRDDFKQKVINNEFFEYEEVHGNFYGTLKKTVSEALSSGSDLILDIDIKGALNFKQQLPKNTVIVFIVPPSMTILKERLMARGKITEEDLSTRLKTAKSELDTVIKVAGDNKIDYLVVNDTLNDTLNGVSGLLLAERARLMRFELKDLKEVCSY